ncbi:DUF2130 domain-containing protein [bacterium]|nr:DUF2130 domain-containing protein [bacterium]
MSNKNCPMCGQVLLNEEAIGHLRKHQPLYDQKIIAAAEYRFKQQLKTETDAVRAEEKKKQDEAVAKARAAAEKEFQAEIVKKNREVEDLKKQQQALVKQEVTKLKPALEAELRKSIEKDFTDKERGLQSVVQKLETQNKQLQDRLDRITGPDKGEFSEDDLVRSLANAFPEDDIRRVGKGRAGADVLQTVRYRAGGELVPAGKIVYENKDQLQWRADFLEQARAACETHQTSHVILVSKVFPNGQKDLFWSQGVAVVAPARAVYLARVVRALIIESHRAGLTREDLSAKLEEIYEYLNSESFRQALDALVQAGEELKVQLQKERKSHERTWAEREQAYNALIKRASGIEAAIRAILQRVTEEQPLTEEITQPELVSFVAD